MNPELKAKWIEALRSGKYRQGQGQLRRPDDTMCCLGVLCEVSEVGEWVDGGSGYWRYKTGNNLDYALPDDDLMDGWGIPDKRINDFIRMNDEEGKSFAEIADYIETHL